MLASGVVLGLLAGLGFGGDWRRLTQVQLRAAILLIPATLLRLAGLVFGLPLAVYVLAFVLFGVVAGLNYRLRGATVIAIGIALNLLVIAVNGGMPVSAEAAAAAGLHVQNDGLHILLTEWTVLPLLADVLPVAPFRNVYSAGDVLLAIGGFWLPYSLLRGK